MVLASWRRSVVALWRGGVVALWRYGVVAHGSWFMAHGSRGVAQRGFPQNLPKPFMRFTTKKPLRFSEPFQGIAVESLLVRHAFDGIHLLPGHLVLVDAFVSIVYYSHS